MSTKIYNGYRFTKAPTLKQLQRISFDIRDRVQPIAANLYYKRFLTEMVDAYDKNQFGYWDESMYFISKMQGDLYSGVDAYLMKRIKHMNASQERDPSIDFNFSYSIIPLQSRNAVLLLLYTEQKLLREAFEATKGIEDYHYQNQTDPPKDVPTRQWNQRSKDWDEALKDGAPAACGFTYEPFTSGRFHFFGLTEMEKSRLTNLIPNLNARAKTIADLQMSDDYEKANPVEPLPENATKQQKEKRYEDGMARYWKFRDFCQTDEGKKQFDDKVSAIKPVLKKFSYKELFNTKIKFHENVQPKIDKELKPFFMRKD